ncbi:MAG: hypothetical protein RSG77_19885 [Hafnia sp.]
MPYYNIVDGRCFVINEESNDEKSLRHLRKLIESDNEFEQIKSDIEEAGLGVWIGLDNDIGWLCVYFGQLINDDNHSYQGKVIVFKKYAADREAFDAKVELYDHRIESILKRLDINFDKEVGTIYNQWD